MGEEQDFNAKGISRGDAKKANSKEFLHQGNEGNKGNSDKGKRNNFNHGFRGGH